MSHTCTLLPSRGCCLPRFKTMHMRWWHTEYSTSTGTLVATPLSCDLISTVWATPLPGALRFFVFPKAGRQHLISRIRVYLIDWPQTKPQERSPSDEALARVIVWKTCPSLLWKTSINQCSIASSTALQETCWNSLCRKKKTKLTHSKILRVLAFVH